MNEPEAFQKIAELVLELDKMKMQNKTLREHNQRLVCKINELQESDKPTVLTVLKTVRY